MYSKFNNCGFCFTPAKRRLALFEAKDEYECYAESYVKCFWGLCDQQKRADSFTKKADTTVITQQPVRQDLTFQSPRHLQSVFVTN